MRLQSIATGEFRNLAPAEVAFGLGLNLVLGSNGQGKTNLVEAIAFLSHLKSFRTRRTAEIVAHGAEAAHVHGMVETRTGRHELAVGIGRGFRRASIDGHAVRGVRDCAERFAVVSVSPEDPAVLDGGPEGRRTLMDRFSALLDPGALAVYSRYSRLLRERNAMLRAGPGAWDEAVIAACEEAMATAGADLVAARLRGLLLIAGRLPEKLEVLSGWDFAIEVRYEARRQHGRAADDAFAFGEDLAQNRVRDATLGYTSIGPHADDLVVSLGGRKARTTASRGQKRMLMLAWKAAEADALREALGEEPVLVMDDALADLDEERQDRVVAFLKARAGQSFLTSAMLREGLTKGASVLRIGGGKVVADQY